MLLFAFSVPCYLPADTRTVIWLGLPAWVVISLLVTIGIGLFTLFVIREYWQEDEEDPDQLTSETQSYE